MPHSAPVGTPGSASQRFLLVTASARSLPALMSGSTPPEPWHVKASTPATVSATAGVLPR